MPTSLNMRFWQRFLFMNYIQFQHFFPKPDFCFLKPHELEIVHLYLCLMQHFTVVPTVQKNYSFFTNMKA